MATKILSPFYIQVESRATFTLIGRGTYKAYSKKRRMRLNNSPRHRHTQEKIKLTDFKIPIRLMLVWIDRRRFVNAGRETQRLLTLHLHCLDFQSHTFRLFPHLIDIAAKVSIALNLISPSHDLGLFPPN